MYARSTSIRSNPDKLDDGIAYVTKGVLPTIGQSEGCIGLSMLTNRDDGRCIVTTSWRDEQSMRATAEDARTLRHHLQHTLGGEHADVQEWDIAVLHRVHSAPEGAATRVIRARGPAGKMDRVAEGFRTIVVPRAEQLPGFCSTSLLINHDEGRCAIATTYENRQTMSRAKGQAVAIREEFLDRMGVHVAEIAEFDLVIASLRVPEMA